MKKSLVLAAVIGATLCLSSCYCDKLTVGNVQPQEELVHVKSTRNHHFLYGLFVSHESTNENVPNVRDYVVENKQTFWDVVVGGVTLGIYTPSTTKYYVPKSNPRAVAVKKKFQSKAYKGYLK